MTDFPDVKLKALVSFPASIIDGAGIDVAKVNGAFRFDIAYDDFAPPLATIADPANSVMLIWNTVSHQYGLAPTALLLGSGSAFPSGTTPIMDGTGAPGSSALYARGDHIHPSDSSRAPIASPTFTGDPKAPTPTAGDNDTSIATTAFVTVAVSNGLSGSGFAPIASPIFTGNPTAPTAAPGDNDTSIATTAFVTAALPVAATAGEYVSNLSPTKMLTPGASWGAAALVALTGTTVAPDLGAGIDSTWTMSSATSTLNNPAGSKPGQKGMLYLQQDGSGNRAITTWGGFYKFPGGVKPTLSTAAGAIDVISFAVRSATEIECFFAAGMA